MPATTGASWLCSPQQTTGKPLELLRERVVLLDARDGGLPGRVGKRHHVRPRRRRQPEPPRQVRVDDVEAAGAEAEVARPAC